jgi:hypothetical protein
VIRLAGIDLNGWRDLAVRNWLEQAGEDQVEEEGAESTHVIAGGVGGVVVTTGEESDGALVGGVQAVLAPHGRGQGWGLIGQKARRRVIDCLNDPETHIDELAAAFAGMGAMRRAVVVAAIPDNEACDEDQREALLTALGRLRPRARLLVWRPVLAVLHALAVNHAAVAGAERVGVISHDGKGFTAQALALRRQDVPAPERRQAGKQFPSPWGLEPLRKQACDGLLARLGAGARQAPVQVSALPVRLALGEEPSPEPLKSDMGRWVLVRPEGLPKLPDVALPEGLAETFADCDAVLFETPATGRVRAALEARLTAALPCPFVSLPVDAVAKGAFEAARRNLAGLPIYYDFLPQISTIVIQQREARNFDLIPSDALLPAGTVYRSERPARLSIPAGAERLKIFLRKETDPNPRRATVTLPGQVPRNEPVELHVQQAPAAGRARLTLVSGVFSAPVQVDWTAAEVLHTDWETLIAEQQPQMPTIPARLVLPAGLAAWEDYGQRPGLLRRLRVSRRTGRVDWEDLANRLTARFEGQYAVSSDGELPQGLAREARELLDWAVAAAVEELGGRRPHEGLNSHALRFLTWTFQRCPAWVADAMLDALEGRPGREADVRQAHATLLWQGVGRTARHEAQQRRAFDLLLARAPERWKKDQMACAAFLLSRTDTAPALLRREEVETIGRIVEARVLEAIGREFTTKYSYGPFLLVGLLRWRLREPWALVAGQDDLADCLLAATRALADSLSKPARVDGRLARYVTILRQVCQELEGAGSNPDLLADLQAFATDA